MVEIAVSFLLTPLKFAAQMTWQVQNQLQNQFKIKFNKQLDILRWLRRSMFRELK